MKRDKCGLWIAERPSEARLVLQANAIERARREEMGLPIVEPEPAKVVDAKRSNGRSTRRAKTSRVDRPRAGGEWTEAAFWGFLRSGFRQMSRRWPPIVRHALHAARRPYVGPNARQKWEYSCAACGGWFAGKEIAVDHIEALGPLKSWDDVAGFLQRLFVEVDGLRVVCHVCHERRTETDRAAKAAASPSGSVAGLLFDVYETNDDDDKSQEMPF